MNAPRLTGGRCQCTVCLDYFGSDRGFDRHRIGEIGTSGRRCQTAEELTAAGWVRDARRFWLQPDARRAGAGVLGVSEGLAATHAPPSSVGPPDSGSQHV